MINIASMPVVTIVRKKVNSQMVENILQNLKCHYCVHMSPSLVPTPS